MGLFNSKMEFLWNQKGGLKKIPILDKRLLEHLYVILYNILEAVINNLKENLRKYHAQNSLVKSINHGWV